MSFTTILYNIIIFPLYQLLEFSYEFMYEATGKEAIAVIGLSFVVTLTTLPLYMIAEKWQETERLITERLKPGVKRIKDTFKGDEQYMILNTFYRQNHYNPIYALRSSLSLVIQIPFFIAAYGFLSNLGELKGVSFLFIKDFGSPDSTFTICGFPINMLPIAMTLINCISGAIYSKGHDIREKIQIYVFAAVFLVILYNSPAGLVVYWTMNNILSLVKNIFYKLKNPKKVLFIILLLFALVCIAAPFTYLSNIKSGFKKVILLSGLVLPFIPFSVIYTSKIFSKHFKVIEDNSLLRIILYFGSAITLALLAGLVIPSQIIESEPENYCYVDNYKSPFVFLFSTFFQAIGFFIFWPGAFYALFSTKVKKIITVSFCILAIICTINTFAFGGHYGPVEAWLEFMTPQNFIPPINQILINLTVLTLTSIILVLILLFKPKIMQSLCSILLLSMFVITAKNSISVNKTYKNMPVPDYNQVIEPIFNLSKSSKNVILIMQDRCFSPYIPYVLEELPELKKSFDGFTFYPNTISMGKLTMIGTPGIYGGYDYTPYRINQRAVEEPKKTIQDKHNEALLTLPLIFSKEGFRVQLTGLPYENYLEQPESTMFINNENIQNQGIEVESFSDPSKTNYTVKYKDHAKIKHCKVTGTFTNQWYSEHNMEKEPFISSQIIRNFIWFSLFKMVPPVLRGGVYHKDYWMAYNPWDNSAKFIDHYSVIDYLPELTEIDSNNGSFIIIANEATHEPVFLQAPNFEFRKASDITDRGTSPLRNIDQYSTMCGVFNKYSEFFDYLKKNDVYDNTKIIIVSDHGMSDNSIATERIRAGKTVSFNNETFIATLLIKDFNSHGAINTDFTFMTNADTPYLATKDIIKDAIHPFTNKHLNVDDKTKYTILNTSPAESTKIRKNKKFEVKDSEWYYVKDDIYEPENWSKY